MAVHHALLPVTLNLATLSHVREHALALLAVRAMSSVLTLRPHPALTAAQSPNAACRPAQRQRSLAMRQLN